MSRHRFIKLVLAVALIFLLSGCWDGVELQKRAIVLMIGVDPSQQGDHNVTVSLQIARPQKFGSSPEASTGSGDENTVVVSRNGVDVIDAIRKIQLSIDRTLFFGHVRGLVVNQCVAQDGVMAFVTPLLQARMASRETWLFISKNPAENVLHYTPLLDSIPSTYLSNFFENRLLLTRPYQATLGGFHQRLVTPGVEPFAIWIGEGDKALSAPAIEGFAVFSEDKFVGGLNQKQAVGWQFIENQFPKSPLTFRCSKEQPGQFIVDVKSVKSRIRASKGKDGQPRATIVIRLNGWIEGGTCVKTTNQKELKALIQQVQSEVETMVQSSIKQCQQLNSDSLGVGQQLYRFSPKVWKGDTWWSETFPHIQTTVQVQVQLDFLQTYKDIHFNPKTSTL